MNAGEVLRRGGMTPSTPDVLVTSGYLRVVGRTQTVGGTSVRVMHRDNAGDVSFATGTTVPADAGTGWAKGAVFVKTDTATGIQNRYFNAGTNESALFRRLSDAFTDKVSVTNAELKDLRATPKVLVAGAGSGLLLEFVSAILVNNGGVNAITESGLNTVVRYTGTTGAIVSQAIESTGWVDQTAKTLTSAMAKIDGIVTNTGSFNQALVWHNSGGAEFGGNAADDVTVDIWVTYRIHDVS